MERSRDVLFFSAAGSLCFQWSILPLEATSFLLSTQDCPAQHVSFYSSLWVNLFNPQKSMCLGLKGRTVNDMFILCGQANMDSRFPFPQEGSCLSLMKGQWWNWYVMWHQIEPPSVQWLKCTRMGDLKKPFPCLYSPLFVRRGHGSRWQIADDAPVI